MTRLTPKPSLKVAGDGLAIEPEQVAMLHAIRRRRSLTKAAEGLHISYRHIWASVKKMEEIAGEKLVVAVHGGRGGGGEARLTDRALRLLKEYDRVSGGMERVSGDEGFWEALGIKLSIRNRLKGTVRSVETEGVASKVVVGVEKPGTITALITAEAARDLQLKPGDQVVALIKATEVAISKKAH